MADLQRRLCLILALLALAVTACSSPEASRTRGGGPGGDIGNHSPALNIHGRTDPYYDTPLYGPTTPGR